MRRPFDGHIAEGSAVLFQTDGEPYGILRGQEPFFGKRAQFPLGARREPGEEDVRFFVGKNAAQGGRSRSQNGRKTNRLLSAVNKLFMARSYHIVHSEVKRKKGFTTEPPLWYNKVMKL